MNNKELFGFSFRELLIFLFAITGLALSTLLVMNDVKMRGYCPYIGSLPSCHLTADGFLMILLSLFLLKKSMQNLFFATGITLGLSISIYLSAMHLMMINPSPMFLDISTSYITVSLFTAVLIAKFLSIKK